MTTRLEVGHPMPPSIGLRADEYHDVREVRLMMEKEVEGVKARENELRESIIADLSKSADTGAAGLRYRAQIVMEAKPKIEDWAKLCKFVAEQGRFELLQKRLGEKAVEEIWDAGYAVPGVEKMRVPEVSITKIPGK